jgi:hypothetical protein
MFVVDAYITVLIGGGTTGALVAAATPAAAGQQQHFIARVRADAGASDSYKGATVWTLQVDITNR